VWHARLVDVVLCWMISRGASVFVFFVVEGLLLESFVSLRFEVDA